MRIRLHACGLCALLAFAPSSVHADSIASVSWLVVGSERVGQAAEFSEAVNTFGYSEANAVSATATSSASISTIDIWQSETAYSEAYGAASVDNLTLKARAHVTGTVQNTLNAVRSCDPTVVPCPIHWISSGGVWQDFMFESLAFAQASDNVSITASSATPAWFRMTFDVEGTHTRLVDYPTPALAGGNGGGYRLATMLHDTTLSLEHGSSWTSLYSAVSDPVAGGLNEVVPPTVTPVVSTVTTPRIGITGQGAHFILNLQTLVRFGANNVDDGRLVFALVNDYGNTVTLRGVEVFDANDALISDAVVTGASGYLYPLLGAAPPPAAVPEPAVLVLVGLGTFVVGRRLRR